MSHAILRVPASSQPKLTYILKRLVPEARVENENDCLLLNLPNGLSSEVKLLANQKALSEDLPNLQGLFVPFFNEVCLKYLNQVDGGSISYLDDVAKKDQSIYKDCLFLLGKIDDETALTVQVYIECDRSPKLAGVRLYVHRNTVNYRVQRFLALTGLSLEGLGNSMFVYHLIEFRFRFAKKN